MTQKEKLDKFFAKEGRFRAVLLRLREIMSQTELKEEYKWRLPVYTLDGKNVAGLGAFKDYFGVWFFQGAMLEDAQKKLMNAQEGKTAAMRQWRFSSEADLDEALLVSYLQEAIQNQKAGRVIKAARPIKKAPAVPQALKAHFEASSQLAKAFAALTPGRQKEFIEYIAEAKRSSTKENRIEKIRPMILAGVGLNDKYR